MRLGWLSDIHLDFPNPAQVEQFLDVLAATAVDAWLIGGDTAEGPSVIVELRRIAARLAVPVYFILGNHDFYLGSFAAVTGRVRERLAGHPRLTWLTAAEPILLSGSVALVGDDGWADARLGDPAGTEIEINDFYRIRELKGLTHAERVLALNRLGDEAAARLGPKLERASVTRRRVVVLTHVPPFVEAASHQGRRSGEGWLPWYTCKAMGDVLLDCAERHPECHYLVLCGHTHAGGSCAPRANLMVLTAAAEYGQPAPQEIIEIE